MTTTERPSVTDFLNENGDLPDEALLGRLVLFTITDEPTPRASLVQWFTDLGLNHDLLPSEIKPVDAFKKATSESKDKYTLPSGEECVVLCRDVETTAGYIKRQITREVREPGQKGKQLSYSRAIECTFYRGRSAQVTDANGKTTKAMVRGTERVHIRVDKTGLSDGELTAVQDIARSLVARYEGYYDNLDGNRLRATVRAYLKYLNALEIKAGAYFVHVSKSAELAALQTLVERMGGGCFMHTIPLVDIARERKMVTAAFERETANALAEVAREARDLAATGTVAGSEYARVKARYDEVTAKATEHLTTLSLSATITEASERTALEALVALQQTMAGGSAVAS
jgi:hypothetical protein